jgi:hypothetical protein
MSVVRPTQHQDMSSVMSLFMILEAFARPYGRAGGKSLACLLDIPKNADKVNEHCRSQARGLNRERLGNGVLTFLSSLRGGQLAVPQTLHSTGPVSPRRPGCV